MARWLVTGGSGFLGRHLLATLANQVGPGDRVVSLGRRLPEGWPIEAFRRVDLDDAAELARTLEAVQPDFVLHAAGATPPADSMRLYQVNTGGTHRLLEAARTLGHPPRVVLIGSAAELGPVPADRLPIGEETPCRPIGAYGLSKWAATRLGLTATPPLEVVVARLFNPIGPGLPTSQAFGRFAGRLSATGSDLIRLDVVGLEVRRDFLDVRDAAGAIIQLAEQGRPGRLYHLGSGRSRSIGEGLDLLIRYSGRPVQVQSSGPGRGPLDSRADIHRIHEELDWSPRISFERSLADLWDGVRRRNSSEPLRVA